MGNVIINVTVKRVKNRKNKNIDMEIYQTVPYGRAIR